MSELWVLLWVPSYFTNKRELPLWFRNWSLQILIQTLFLQMNFFADQLFFGRGGDNLCSLKEGVNICMCNDVASQLFSVFMSIVYGSDNLMNLASVYTC